jgi:hypothetical protein
MATLILPEPPEIDGFNRTAEIPFGITIAHVYAAMQDFIDFLSLIDGQLQATGMTNIENTIMPANFSSLLARMMCARIPKHCPTVVSNRYHNGHPNILPAGKYPGDGAEHAGSDGIEVKASRYLHGWQGHNAEDVWLMVFVFQSGREEPKVKKTPAFKFLLVAGALLSREDWLSAGRSEASRRTTTATVTKAGAAKMMENWI